MKRNVRWMLPVTAAVGLLVGVSAMSVRAADEAKPAGKGNISGTVVDKDGKGVADVEVRVMKPGMRGGRGPGGPGGPGGAEGKKPADQATVGQGARPLQAEGEKPREGRGPGAGGPGAGGRGPRPEPVATATTDKDGKFEVKGVAAGEYMVGVRDQDKKVFGMSRVTVKDGETATVEIKTSDTPPMRRGGPGGPGGPGGGQGGGGGGGGGAK